MKNSEHEDKSLLEKIRHGNESAYKKIYDKYHKALYRVAHKYLRNKELAEDAVHDIFLKLWDNRKRMNRSGSLRGFLFTALKNHVLNMINRDKMKLKKKIKLTYEKKIDRLETGNIIALSEYRDLYQKAVRELPEKRREVFELRTKEGLTNNEVAQYLEVSMHTVKSQYYKASKFVRTYVNRRINNKETGT